MERMKEKVVSEQVKLTNGRLIEILRDEILAVKRNIVQLWI